MQLNNYTLAILHLNDHILFTIETENDNQILTWMTRRYLKLLFPILQG